MEQSPSWEAKEFWASQDIPCILWKPKVHYRIQLTYLVTYLLICSMEQIPSWEAKRFSASQEIPCILWKLKVHYWIHLTYLLTYLLHGAESFLRS